MSSSGRSSRSTRGLSAAQTPITIPNATASAVATSTWEAVSIASAQTPITPIAASIRKAVIAGRSPLSTKAIAVRPPSTMNHGVSTSTLRSGSRRYSSRKFPIGSVMPKMNELGSCT